MTFKEFEEFSNNSMKKASQSLSSGCLEALSRNNNFKQIVTGGAKGTVGNISQIMKLGGQVNISGQRIPNGLHNRVLSWFQQYDRRAEVSGMVLSNFASGLSPHEYVLLINVNFQKGISSIVWLVVKVIIINVN
jgi:DNA-directed RNA polymerase beta' subunit